MSRLKIKADVKNGSGNLVTIFSDKEKFKRKKIFDDLIFSLFFIFKGRNFVCTKKITCRIFIFSKDEILYVGQNFSSGAL